MVDRARLESGSTFTGTGSSNLPLSARLFLPFSGRILRPLSPPPPRVSLGSGEVLMRRILLTCLVVLGTAWGQAAKPAGPDLTKQPTLYVVPYAHLDTSGDGSIPPAISEYILNTMRDNFALFEKYPHYVFNLTGANRYRLMKEYFPADYARSSSTWMPAAGFPPARRWKKATSTCPAPKPSSARSFTAKLFPQGVRQGQRRIHAAGLLRLSRLAAQHSGSRRRQRLLHAEAERGAARPHGGRPGFAGDRRPSASHSMWASGRARMARA